MEISEPLQGQSESIYSQEDFPVKTSLALDESGESTLNDLACGLNSLGLLGNFDPDSYSLRTSQVCLITNLCDEFLETFPRAGTMLNGKVFQRPPLVPLTFATGFGYLPTPDKSTGVMRGGIAIRANAQTSFRKEIGETRPSGVNGIPRAVVDARNGALGNAVVPQVAEWIGRRIIEAHTKPVAC